MKGAGLGFLFCMVWAVACGGGSGQTAPNPPTSGSGSPAAVEAQWLPPQKLSAGPLFRDANGGIYVADPTLAASGGDAMLAAWEGNFGRRPIKTARFANGAWTSPVEISEMPGYHPRISSNSSGAGVLTWSQWESGINGASAWLSRYDVSSGWTVPARFAGPIALTRPPCHCAGWRPDLRPVSILGPNGDFQVYWWTRDLATTDVWSQVFVQGAGWQSPVETFPRTAFAGADIRAGARPFTTLFWALRTDLATADTSRFSPSGWSTTQVPATFPNPQVVTEWGEGGLAIIGTTEVRMTLSGYQASGALSWSRTVDTASYARLTPAAMGNRAGQFAAAYFDDPVLRLLRRSAEGVWQELEPLPILLPRGYSSAVFKVALDELGWITVVYGHETATYAARYSPEATSAVRTAIGPLTEAQPALRFDSSGNLHALWSAAIDGGEEIWTRRLVVR